MNKLNATEVYALYYKERMRNIELKKEYEKLSLSNKTLKKNYQELVRVFCSNGSDEISNWIDKIREEKEDGKHKEVSEII